MEKIDIIQSKLHPDVYYKSSKNMKKYNKVSGESPEEVSAEVHKEKPVGQKGIIRTIKFMKEDLRQWVESIYKNY